MKKLLIILIIGMFIASSLPGILGDNIKVDCKIKEKRFIETRNFVPVLTAHGLEKAPGAKGKPGVFVTITNPSDGDTVSGTVEIKIDTNENPTIKIDGAEVGTGETYNWDTAGYSDGTHTIEASAKGHTDIVAVTVDNGGGNTPPVVTITNPNDGETVSGTVTITVTAIDAEDGYLTADIYIDYEYIATSNSYDWDTTGYSDGIHTIYADATDSGGLTGSDEITVTIDNEGGGEGEVEKYALVIGIADYRGRMNDLRYCDDDAMDWKEFLQNNGYTVKTLIDSQAKANNIENEIDNLLALEDGNDYVVITYSGHGAKYTGYGSCIISHDLYYITHGWFESKFSSADSQHIYFTFDACVIGDFQGLILDNRVGAFASNDESSWETNEFENGVFTYYQIEGWDSYDTFEQDGSHASTKMTDWADDNGYTVDPFVEDNYVGYMYP